MEATKDPRIDTPEKLAAAEREFKLIVGTLFRGTGFAIMQVVIYIMGALMLVNLIISIMAWRQ